MAFILQNYMTQHDVMQSALDALSNKGIPNTEEKKPTMLRFQSTWKDPAAGAQCKYGGSLGLYVQLSGGITLSNIFN